MLDGKLRRFPSDPNRRHSKDAWYVGFDDSQGRAGAFGSWRDGATHKWSNSTGRQLTAEELASIQTQREAARKKAQAEANAAAQRAQRILAAAADNGESAYLARKKIRTPDGVRFVKNLDATAFGFEKSWKITGILVPMRNLKGDIRSLQIIADGVDKKFFMPDGQTMGLFHVLGGALEGAKRIIIAEGIATAQSCHESTGCVAVSAFSAGNLERTAIAIRSLNATAEIILAADGDKIGREQAQLAASTVNGRVIAAPEGQDFNDVPLRLEETETGAPMWRTGLIVKNLDDGTQKILCRTHNLILILEHAPEFLGRIRYNEFSMKAAIDGKDEDEVGNVIVKASLEKNWIPDRISSLEVREAVMVVASQRPFHPVKDYLESLPWDDVPRIDYYLSDICGTPHDSYHIGVSRAIFISAVSRVYQPGCTVHTTTTLIGAQGTFKSTSWRVLFGEWYAEVVASLRDKDFFSGLRGIWCADFGEMDQLSYTEQTRVKQILTADVDHYRTHYGHYTKKYPRQGIFVAGTNTEAPFTDASGARRYLPVHITSPIDIETLKNTCDQLWAEALVLYRQVIANNIKWWDVPDAREHQDACYKGDTWEEVISRYLLGKEAATMAGILTNALDIEPGKQTKADQTRAGHALHRLGWSSHQTTLNGARIREYRRQRTTCTT
ncbi:Toprim domain-containing protein [Gammaproteobacteria bacterium]